MRVRLLLLLFLGILPGYAQQPPSCNKILEFKKLLETQHVNSQTWDEAFTKRAIGQLFSLVDPQAMYFTAEEQAQFLDRSAVYRQSMTEGNCKIVLDLVPIYKKALTRAERIVQTIQASPLNVNEPDTFRLNVFHESSFYSEAQLKIRWRRIIKLGVLLDVVHQGSSKDYKTALEKNCKKYFSIIKRRQNTANGLESYLFEKTMNAIATSYDPHTEFFPKNEAQSFRDNLSTDQLSFGLIFQDDALGNVTINRVIPGSAAWDAGNLHEKDIVLSIKTSSADIDASLYSAEEIEDMLEPLQSPIEISLKKVTGERITTRLEKQRIRKDENKIKSLVLSDKVNRFGYVNLPVFFSGLPNAGCADELAKEIIHLKKARIQGLILDLRNNGGGDLEEAIELCGIFIDRGAIGILKSKTGELEALRDVRAGVAYDGPLLVMINGGSASASEIFASAMRAHHRALLVGSATYGKGTGQSVLPFAKTDLVKITSFRFYDPNGKSHQGRGLKPDVQLPDYFSLFDFHENRMPYALACDSVVKKTYFTPLEPLPIDILRDSAQQRILKNPFFKNVRTRITKQNPFIDPRGVISIPLTIADIQRFETEDEKDNEHPVSDRYTIKLTAFDEQLQGIDQFENETFKILIDEISKDHYLDESLRILAQYLTIQKK